MGTVEGGPVIVPIVAMGTGRRRWLIRQWWMLRFLKSRAHREHDEAMKRAQNLARLRAAEREFHALVKRRSSR